MSAAALLSQAQAAGLALLLAPPDNIVVRGPADARARLLPEIRAHKAALVALLTGQATGDTHRLWTITEPGGATWDASFTPPKDRGAVLKGYPPGTRAEPCPSATQPTGRPLTGGEVASVRAALDAMGEDDPDTRREILERCQGNAEALAYWLARAPAPDTWDDRRTCRACNHLVKGLCQAAARGELPATARKYRPPLDTPRRCEGYTPGTDDPDRRTGRERWPFLLAPDLGRGDH